MNNPSSPATEPHQPSVSIQGYQGSFHHIAAEQWFGKDMTQIERSTFAEVFADLINQSSDFSICAVENTIAGSVTESLDLLRTQPVQVVGEIALRVQQNLIVIPGTKISELKTVYSHPVALQQCLKFFSQYPHITLVSTDDTGKSVERMMRQGDKAVGSVGSQLAAELFKAEIIAQDIETHKKNYTRFFILARAGTKQQFTQNSELKSSLILTVPNTVGALAKILTYLAQQDCNLIKIESRPILGKPWEYAIYIDMLSTHSPAKLNEIAQNLTELTASLKILGHYAPGRIVE